MKQLIIQNDINKLIVWALQKDFYIEFKPNKQDITIFDDNIININSSNLLETQLYALIHECGHVILYNDKNYKKNFPYASEFEYPIENKKIFNNNHYKFDIINEEIKAWEKGKKLAKKLKININEEKFRKEMVKAVFSYIRYLTT